MEMMVAVASCLRIIWGFRVYSRNLPGGSEEAAFMSQDVRGALPILTGRVCVPVDQPWLLGAGQRRAQFLRLGSYRHSLELSPGKVPLDLAPCCYGIAVHGGAQVGMNTKRVHQISRVSTHVSE